MFCSNPFKHDEDVRVSAVHFISRQACITWPPSMLIVWPVMFRA